MQYSIDITTEQSFRDLEFIGAKLWISKHASLCQVFADRVTNGLVSLVLSAHTCSNILCYTRYSIVPKLSIKQHAKVICIGLLD